ncbi:MAG: hypothetical protein LBQ76_03635 [Candidatus Fibromonas sp.]|jgi:hypothetical protein|nr:hypothetical protein [Candidatus Fibromonas sp.]
MRFVLILLFLAGGIFARESLDIRILRVEFIYEDPDNSLTTGRGTFGSEQKGNYKLDPKDSRASEEYWLSHIKFAENYFERAAGAGEISFSTEVYPKGQNAYKLPKRIIDYNRTTRKKGEKMAEFDSARAVDYASFVNDVLGLAKEWAKDGKSGNPFAPSAGKRVILIAHAGSSRLIDGGTLGTRGADTPGDFMDAYIDTTWGEFWKGFEVDSATRDSIKSVMVSSETASQDGLNWGINGSITSQIGRELGLPYSYDVVKGYSRLGYFDGMDFAGYNAGNGFFPSLPSAWMRYYKGWGRVKEISPRLNRKDTVEICAAGYELCDSPQIVKIPINNNEYILLENRQRTSRADGEISVGMLVREGVRKTVEIPVDSLYSHFLDSASQKETGVIEYVDEIDAAIPASGIAAWHVNDWFVKELIPYGAVNAWNGDTFRDHQFGIALIEASGVLGLGKEFRNAAGESVFYFGSGSDLIPHKKFNEKKQFDTLFSINPVGYANSASTFGGYSGIKITAKIPSGAKQERTLNLLTGDSVITWRALKIPVEIEWVGEYIRPVLKEDLPPELELPKKEDFPHCQENKSGNLNKGYNLGSEIFCPIYGDINNDGVKEAIFLGNNRLYAVDSNGVPLKNFPVLLSNGEPFTNFRSKPLAIDIDGNDSLEILIPANNGLILAVNGEGKLLKKEFPVAAGVFTYDTVIPPPMQLFYNEKYKYLFVLHRDSVKAFYLPKAKEFTESAPKPSQYRDEISEFFIYPNPIRRGKAAMRFRIENYASSATLDVFDITGFKVFSRSISNVNYGSNQIDGLDLSNLGSDVYSARLTVKFDKKKKEKWVRIGVIRM